MKRALLFTVFMLVIPGVLAGQLLVRYDFEGAWNSGFSGTVQNEITHCDSRYALKVEGSKAQISTKCNLDLEIGNETWLAFAYYPVGSVELLKVILTDSQGVNYSSLFQPEQSGWQYPGGENLGRIALYEFESSEGISLQGGTKIVSIELIQTALGAELQRFFLDNIVFYDGEDNLPPPAPVDLSAIREGNNVTVSWGFKADDSGIAAYELYRGDTPGFLIKEGELIGKTTRRSLSFPLPPGSKGYYKVQAIDYWGNGSAASEALCLIADNVPPPSPTNLTITTLPEGNTLELTWRGLSRQEIEDHSCYLVLRKKAGEANWIERVSLLAKSTSYRYVDYALEDGVVYHYQVLACDTMGNRSQPAEGSGIPMQIAPYILKATFESGIADGWYVSGGVGYLEDDLTHLGSNYAMAGKIENGPTHLYIRRSVEFGAIFDTYITFSYYVDSPDSIAYMRLNCVDDEGYAFIKNWQPVKGSWQTLTVPLEELKTESGLPLTEGRKIIRVDVWARRATSVGDHFLVLDDFTIYKGQDHDPPQVIDDLRVRSWAEKVELSWSVPSDVSGVVSFDLYRGTKENFDLSEGVLVNAEPLKSNYFSVEPPQAGEVHYYRVLSKDAWGNASVLSNTIKVQAEAGTGQLWGTIVGLPWSEPIEGARIYTAGFLAATTDAQGRFRLTDLPPGQREIRVQADSFAEKTFNVSVTGGVTELVTWKLAPQQITTISDQEFFQLLNLELPGLIKVKEAVAAADWDKAKEELCEYYLKRENPKYYYGPAEQPEPDPRYNAQTAELICAHLIRNYQFARDIDWNVNPTENQDREWTWGLNRHYHFVDLARAYWYTGQDRYAEEFACQLLDWLIDMQVPEGESGWTARYSSNGWRTIETGIRMFSTWIPSWFYLQNAEGFMVDARISFLKSLIEHARYLYKFNTSGDNGGLEHNWCVMEFNGLFHIGLLFPEFKEANQWLERAVLGLTNAAERQIYPDGAQWELAPGYHNTVLSNFLQSYRLAHHNDLPLPIAKTIEKMFECIMYILKPRGQMPIFNDTGTSNMRSRLLEGYELFGREDFLYLGTAGQQGTPPTQTSVALPYAGWFALRENWQPDARYLIFEAGPYGMAHQHEDKLSFEVQAFGRDLICDGGIGTYVGGPWRSYFLSTQAHNTIVVDGKGQRRSPKRDTWATVAPLPEDSWFFSQQLDYVKGKYDDGYGTEGIDVVHERHIFYVRPQYWIIYDLAENRKNPQATHRYTNIFHLAPGAAEVDYSSNSVRTTFTDANILVMADDRDHEMTIIAGQLEPEIQGWVSTGYDKREAAPTILLEQTKSGTASFGTLLFPYQGVDSPKAEFERIPVYCNSQIVSDNEAVAFRVSWEEGEDYLYWSRNPQPAAFSDFELDGTVALIRFDKKGNVYSVLTRACSFLNWQGKPLAVTYKEIVIVPGEITLKVGESTRFRLIGYDDAHKPHILDASWELEGDIGIITEDGLFTAQREGEGVVKTRYFQQEFQSVVKVTEELPQTLEFALLSLKPRPGKQLEFQLELNTPADVTIEVIGIDGRKLGTWYEGRLDGGTHTLKLQAKDLSGKHLRAGPYICRLNAANDLGKMERSTLVII